MFVRLTAPIALAVSLLAPAVAAQTDMIGISWAMGVFTFNSYSGSAAQPLGPGLGNHNGLAIADGRLYASHRTGSSSYHLVRVDPSTGNASIVFGSQPDTRDFASDPSYAGVIWAVLDGSPDWLALLDPSTGVYTRIGSLGYSAVQALVWHRGVLYAADNVAGLLVVDPATGRATDVDPSIGSPTDRFQFLISRSDGTLLGGNNNLYDIDPSTGSFAQRAALGSIDLRGAVEWFGVRKPIGTGCNGPLMQPVGLKVGGSLSAGGTIDLSSGTHAPGVPGVLFLSLNPLPAPFPLDPLFGTMGCTLWVLPELNVPGTTTLAAQPTLDFRLRPGADLGGLVLYAQHLVLDPVPGGVSATNGAFVRIGF